MPVQLVSCQRALMWIEHGLRPVLIVRDPSTALVGFSWDAADEKKARSSFGLGRRNFGLFYDAQKIAAQLNYSRFGLGRLCEAILGLDLPKPKHVSAPFHGRPLPEALPCIGPSEVSMQQAMRTCQRACTCHDAACWLSTLRKPRHRSLLKGNM